MHVLLTCKGTHDTFIDEVFERKLCHFLYLQTDMIIHIILIMLIIKICTYMA
jgi:hypothetical protein